MTNSSNPISAPPADRRQRFVAAFGVVATHVLNPPGWIPAWAMTALYLLAQHILVISAVQSDIDIERIKVGLDVSRLSGDVYKVTLGTWLSYKGLSGLAASVIEWKRIAAGLLDSTSNGASKEGQ